MPQRQKPTLAEGTPVRITRVPSSPLPGLYPGALGVILQALAPNGVGWRLDDTWYPPGSVWVYLVGVRTSRGLTPYGVCDAELEPLD